METDVAEPDSKQTESVKVESRRRLIFISHATPEDNVFAEWLATQLAIAGYEVWCDVTELLGGEKFWSDIAEAIDQYTYRFLFVSTLEGNQKSGTLRELEMARTAQERDQLKDFIVPLKIDAFPFASMESGLQDLNIMRFDQGWSAGLTRLLDLLEREQAPRSGSANADIVSEWYQRSIEATRKVVISNDQYLSNWFRLELPDNLYFHRFRGPPEQLLQIAALHEYPSRVHDRNLISFSASPNYEGFSEDSFDVDKTVQIETLRFINEGDPELAIDARDAANMVTDLVRQAWEAEMKRRELCEYPMSGHLAWFFRKGRFDKERLYYGERQNGRRPFRQIVGKKSKRTADGKLVPDGNWHYAISASPQLLPFPRISLKHHVVFTDDGETPWSHVERMVKARRKVCKSWWNREWRDRMLAFCGFLGEGTEVLQLAAGKGVTIDMELAPMSFLSPWRYYEDNETGLDEDQDIELVEEEDEPEEGDEPTEGEGDD